MREDPADGLSARLLASQYLQRYRETLDVGDVTRGIGEAAYSLRRQPAHNAAADELAASGYYALHDFTRALYFENLAHGTDSADANAPSQMALLAMELGHYAQAQSFIREAARAGAGPAEWSAEARYDELTGSIDSAKALMERAAQRSDAVIDTPASSRAWYHVRLGEMAFATGDVNRAEAEEHIALVDFPRYELAYRALARFCWADRDWRCALDTARTGAQILPEPEILGYESDAQRALGDVQGARRTRDLIFAVERIGNAYHINDRLLATYYSEHGVRLEDAFAIAQREVTLRGTEIFAQDTFAWAAAMAGRWAIADRASANAMRFNTQDSRILFHAGAIAYHFGRTARARALLRRALALNAHFDPFYTVQAQSMLATLSQ